VPFELSVTVKNDDKRMTKKHLVYEECTISEEDPIIKGAIYEAISDFGAEKEDLDIRVKISMEVQ
jgi:hypothetical protein